jgi:hypothetical protein
MTAGSSTPPTLRPQISRGCAQQDGSPQLAQVFDRVHRLAGMEAKAERDEDAAILAAIVLVEFTAERPD